jgi:hypothetical protein
MNDATQTAAQPDAAQPQLTIADLQNIRILIDVATKRGAFGASEMSAVGATFDRLNTFLNAVAPTQEAPDTTQNA